LILVGLGVLFLLEQFLRIDIWAFAWPFIIIAFGGLFFVGMVTGGKSAGGLAIPGSIISMIGLILLYQNTSGYWETWAYAWTLIITAVGIGMFIMGVWSGQEGARRAGVSVAGVGVVLFLVFGAFFELGASFLGLRRTSGLLWPLMLIAAGLYLLISRSGLFRRRTPTQPSSTPSVSPIVHLQSTEMPSVEPANKESTNGGVL
jgi:hypothetical protein